MSSKLERWTFVVIMVTTVVMACAGPAFGADPKPVYQAPAVAPGEVGVSLNLCGWYSARCSSSSCRPAVRWSKPVSVSREAGQRRPASRLFRSGLKREA